MNELFEKNVKQLKICDTKYKSQKMALQLKLQKINQISCNYKFNENIFIEHL